MYFSYLFLFWVVLDLRNFYFPLRKFLKNFNLHWLKSGNALSYTPASVRNKSSYAKLESSREYSCFQLTSFRISLTSSFNISYISLFLIVTLFLLPSNYCSLVNRKIKKIIWKVTFYNTCRTFNNSKRICKNMINKGCIFLVTLVGLVMRDLKKFWNVRTK